jgi:hypothetical protein
MELGRNLGKMGKGRKERRIDVDEENEISFWVEIDD